MASVTIARPTHSPAPMSRRVPLSNLHAAVNSPLKNGLASTTVNGKRQRSASVVREIKDAQPPSKKQAVEAVIPKTPVRQKQSVTEKKAPLRRAVRVKTIIEQPQEHARGREDERTNAGRHDQVQLAQMCMWQKHYRKAFPGFVFYFENIPDELALKCYKQVKGLGSKIERFFSSSVTHVVTTRTIPPEGPQKASQQDRASFQNETVNPLLIQKNGDSLAALRTQQKKRAAGSVNGRNTLEYEPCPANRASNDILIKAREYGMKIWSLDKFVRIMKAMADTIPSSRVALAKPTMTVNYNAAPEDKLSKALADERIHGPSDRDPTALKKELTLFKGPFLLVRDLTDVHRPIMVREYAKKQHREDGEWPQFRNAEIGKCPFIEDVRSRARMEGYESRQQKREAGSQKASVKTTMQPPERRAARTTAQGAGSNQLRTIMNGAVIKQLEPPFQPKKASVATNEMAFTSNAKLSANQVQQSLSKQVHEPFASGMQPSNITSAIRSQVVSSHTEIHGTKAGMSKDMYDLKRKVAGNLVMDKTSKGIVPSQSLVNLAAVANENQKPETKNSAAALERKRRSQLQKLDIVYEKVATAKTVPTPEVHNPKPGYCENCREKFDDFEVHCESRRHRKFAATEENWAELDELLSVLTRKMKPMYEAQYMNDLCA